MPSPNPTRAKHTITFAGLTAFTSAAHAHGFAPAARLLGLHRDTVRQRVRNLEAAVGAPLLCSPGGNRPVELTPYGKTFYAASTVILDQLRRALDASPPKDPANVALDHAPPVAPR